MYEDVLTCQLIPASCSVGKLPASILVNAFADIVIASGYHVPAAFHEIPLVWAPDGFAWNISIKL